VTGEDPSRPPRHPERGCSASPVAAPYARGGGRRDVGAMYDCMSPSPCHPERRRRADSAFPPDFGGGRRIYSRGRNSARGRFGGCFRASAIDPSACDLPRMLQLVCGRPQDDIRGEEIIVRSVRTPCHPERRRRADSASAPDSGGGRRIYSRGRDAARVRFGDGFRGRAIDPSACDLRRMLRLARGRPQDDVIREVGPERAHGGLIRAGATGREP
jgi:hypothetical protein